MEIKRQSLPAINEQNADNFQLQARGIVDNLPAEPGFEQLPPEPVKPPPLEQAELEPPMQEVVEQEQAPQPLRRSGRERRQPARFADYVPHQQIAFEALMEPSVDCDVTELKQC